MLVYFKKPADKKADYLKADELEEVGWEIIDEIKRAGEEYGERLGQVKVQIEKMEEKMLEMKEKEKLMDEKSLLIEDMLSEMKKSEEIVQEKKMIEETLEKKATEFLHKEKETQKETVSKQDKKDVLLKEQIKKSPNKKREIKFDLENLKTAEEKKMAIYELDKEGYTIEEIADLTNSNQGFVEVLVNMSRIRRNG